MQQSLQVGRPVRRAVVFDLDDTLYPERDFAMSGFRAVAAAFAEVLGPPDEAQLLMSRLFDSPHRPRVFNELLRQRGVADAELWVTRMIACYREHTPTLRLYADADRALVRLHGSYAVGLISDGPAKMQRAKLASLALEPRLDAILLTAELGEGFAKPHPLAFEEMSRRLGVDPRGCVYVADNPAKDFVAPNRLGWRSVRVLRPDHVYAAATPPPGGEPHVTLATLDELESAMGAQAPHMGGGLF